MLTIECIFLSRDKVPQKRDLQNTPFVVSIDDVSYYLYNKSEDTAIYVERDACLTDCKFTTPRCVEWTFVICHKDHFVKETHMLFPGSKPPNNYHGFRYQLRNEIERIVFYGTQNDFYNATIRLFKETTHG